jgi:hypothetical protein
MTVDLVNRIPGAIAFIDASQVGRGMHLVRIDGRLPGDKGYAVR